MVSSHKEGFEPALKLKVVEYAESNSNGNVRAHTVEWGLPRNFREIVKV